MTSCSPHAFDNNTKAIQGITNWSLHDQPFVIICACYVIMGKQPSIVECCRDASIRVGIHSQFYNLGVLGKHMLCKRVEVEIEPIEN